MNRLKNPHQEESHFWPAYVDALTNVILNLLFFVALMAICVFTVGVGQTDRQGDFLSYLRMLTQRPEKAELRFKVHSKPEPAQEASSMAYEIRKLETSGETKLMSLTFKERASVFAKSDLAQENALDKSPLRQALVDQGIANQAHVKVWVECECRDPVDRRSAYLRVMAVRNALISMGLSQEKVSMRLLTDEIKMNNPHTVLIEWGKTGQVE